MNARPFWIRSNPLKASVDAFARSSMPNARERPFAKRSHDRSKRLRRCIPNWDCISTSPSISASRSATALTSSSTGCFIRRSRCLAATQNTGFFRIFLQSPGSRPLSRDSISGRDSRQNSPSLGANQRQILSESLGYENRRVNDSGLFPFRLTRDSFFQLVRLTKRANIAKLGPRIRRDNRWATIDSFNKLRFVSLLLCNSLCRLLLLLRFQCIDWSR